MTDSMAEPPPRSAPPGEVREVHVGPPAEAVAVAAPPGWRWSTAPAARVRFGPVVAGLLTTLTALLLLGLLGVALGLAGVDPGPAGQATGPPPAAGPLAAFSAVLSAFVAFLFGGRRPAHGGRVRRGWGALDGALVFMLAVPVACR